MIIPVIFLFALMDLLFAMLIWGRFRYDRVAFSVSCISRSRLAVRWFLYVLFGIVRLRKSRCIEKGRAGNSRPPLKASICVSRFSGTRRS